jgi:hypothetical protein
MGKLLEPNTKKPALNTGHIYPGLIRKGLVLIKKGSHGPVFDLPTGMEGLAFTKWKERNSKLLDEVHDCSSEEWFQITNVKVEVEE